MDSGTAMTVLVTLVGLQTTIIVAAIPWAFAVQSRLASIEAKAEFNPTVINQVFATERTVGGLTKDVEHIKAMVASLKCDT